MVFKSLHELAPQYLCDKRFKKYSIAALGVSTTITVVCIAIGIPREDFSGYGDKGMCLICKFWPNLFAFTVPIATVMVASIILTTLTIYKLRSKEKENKKVLRMKTSESLLVERSTSQPSF